MSLTLEEEGGKRYGIIPDKKSWYAEIMLPMPFGKDQYENLRSELEQNLKGLFESSKIIATPDHLEIRVSNPWLIFFKKKESIQLKHRSNNIVIKTEYFRSKGNRAVFDTILRKTCLGYYLKQYWIENESISEKEAQKRLVEITPYSDRF